ncbi:hypothetical protein OY671_009804, partial [Metschnikowia pulcherrima]
MAATNGPPGPLRDVSGEASADMRAGSSRAAASQASADRCGSPSVRQWTAASAQADASGISSGPVLREQGRLCRSERAWRAERSALQAPVKMSLPLIGCIFPCTFIVSAFPIAVRLSQGGCWPGRMRGLSGRRPPGPRSGSLSAACRAVHTFGMRHAIDVVFVARD